MFQDEICELTIQELLYQFDGVIKVLLKQVINSEELYSELLC